MKHITVFSHGFGVQQDARGMFSEIAEALPGVECRMFNYNLIDEVARTVAVRTLGEQAKILEAQVGEVRRDNPEAIIDLVCHSQGCVVAGLATLVSYHIRKILLLAPPATMNFERMLHNFQSRPGTVIDMTGTSRLARRDGSFTLVPAEYFHERQTINPLELYTKLGQESETVIIRATEDEILGDTDFAELKRVRVIDLEGNHDFSRESRQELIQKIQMELL